MTTITINGQPVEATRIDELNQTLLQTRDHVVPAMHDGQSVRLDVAQILGLLEREDLAEKLFAEDIKYDPGTGGPLSAENVQEALDEIAKAVPDSQWANQPIGVPIPLLDNLVGVAAPPTDKGYRYIKLTASDGYNSGVLTGQSVTGSAPLIVATAVIDLAGSPINGETVNLINTERRFLRAGDPGETQDDALQGHHHELYGQDQSITSGGAQLWRKDGATFVEQLLSDGSDPVREPKTDGVNGTPRIADETRVKNIGVTYYMRIK